MTKIVEHGRQFIGAEVDDRNRNITTLTYRIWCKTESGEVYHRYVDIDTKNTIEVPENWTDLDDKLLSDIVNRDIQQQLDQAQADLEKTEATKFEVPNDQKLQDPNDPNREHTGGPSKCWCGMVHPRHEPSVLDCDQAPLCWCQKKHCGVGITH